MKIVVTGAGGMVGRAVVARLQQENIEILAIDKRDQENSDVNWMTLDLCDLGSVYSALEGAQAVIHLGAIPSPHGAPIQVVYHNNVMSQFNICEAAANLGIQRVVYASSVSALGFPFQHRWSEPLYFPIDEQHPLLPQDAYGLSKATGEHIAEAYCRRGAGSAASLRFSTVLDQSNPKRYQGLINRVREHPQRSAAELWAYIDTRDAAEACWLAASQPFEGHQPLFITADDTTAERPTAELLAHSYPTVPVQAGERPERWSLVANTRASQVLGFRPRYRWSEVLVDQH